MKTKAWFTQSDLTKALRAAKLAGWDVCRVEMEPGTGKIVLFAGEPQTEAEAPNPWDEIHKPEYRARSEEEERLRKEAKRNR